MGAPSWFASVVYRSPGALARLGIVGLGLGYAAVFAAILADVYMKALVNAVRFHSGA